MDLWELGLTTNEDVLMLNVAVHNFVQVDILHPNRQLREEVLCVILGKMVLAKSIHIVKQVSTSCPLSHDVGEVVNLEMVGDVEHVFALCAALLGLNFRDGKLHLLLTILIACNGFDGDTEPSDAMLGKDYIFLTGIGHVRNCFVLSKR